MSRQEQLDWESRFAKPAAAAAFAGGALLLAAIPLRTGFSNGAIDERLRRIDDEAGRYIAGTALGVVATILLGAILLYLYRATRARRQEMVKAASVLTVAGVLLFAGLQVATTVTSVGVADQFVSEPIASNLSKIRDPQKYLEAVDPKERADKLAADSALTTLTLVSLAGLFSLGFSLVVISLNAMRSGLLSRFMGVMGIGLGVLFAIGGGFLPVLFSLWLFALGAIFWNRWPGGRGPAWSSGVAEEWPSATKQRQEAMETVEPPTEADAAADEAARPAPRKRKRRRGRR